MSRLVHVKAIGYVLAVVFVAMFAGLASAQDQAPAPPAADAALPAAATAPAAPAPPTVAPAGPTGKFFCQEPIHDFGEVDEDQKVEHAFVIRNNGEAPLENITTQTSCGCTVAKLEITSLAPGEETKVAATLSLKGRQGELSKSITVKAGDAQNPVDSIVLTLKGIVTAPIMYEPRMFNFGKVMGAAPEPVKVVVRSAQESFKIIGATCSEPSITIAHNAMEEGKVYELVASMASLPAAGQLNAVVTVETDHPKRPKLVISVFADVTGPIDVTPRTIVFRQSDDPAQKITQVLKVAPGTVTSFEVTEVISPDERIKIELMPRENSIYLIKVMDLPCDGSLDGKELIVKTSAAELPEVRIPFKMIKVPAQAISPQLLRPNAERKPAAPAAPPAIPPGAGNQPVTPVPVPVPAPGK